MGSLELSGDGVAVPLPAFSVRPWRSTTLSLPLQLLTSNAAVSASNGSEICLLILHRHNTQAKQPVTCVPSITSTGGSAIAGRAAELS